VHGNWKNRDPMGPMGFPLEWEYDQPWDGNGIKVRGKWELRCGSGKKSLHTVSPSWFRFLFTAMTNLSMFGYNSGPELWADGEVHTESLVHFLGLHE